MPDGIGFGVGFATVLMALEAEQTATHKEYGELYYTGKRLMLNGAPVDHVPVGMLFSTRWRIPESTVVREQIRRSLDTHGRGW